MADFNQPCADTVTIVDSYSRVVAYEKSIDEVGLVPTTLQYPSNLLTPGGALAFYDTFGASSSKKLSDGFTSGDAIGPYAIGKGCSEAIAITNTIAHNIVKYLSEEGLLPETTLYPHFGLFPYGAIQVDDSLAFGFYRPLEDSFGSSDTISSVGIGKGLNESVGVLDFKIKAFSKYISEPLLYIDDIQGFGFHNLLSDNISISDAIGNTAGKYIADDITVLDVISYGLGAYLNDNIDILDQISKHEFKSLTDLLTIEDDIVKNILSSLSEYMTIDDDIEVTLRTLVRATLRAIKVDDTTLRAL